MATSLGAWEGALRRPVEEMLVVRWTDWVMGLDPFSLSPAAGAALHEHGVALEGSLDIIIPQPDKDCFLFLFTGWPTRKKTPPPVSAGAS
jgi:hypothetical protein